MLPDHRFLRLGLGVLFAGFAAATPTARALLNIDGTRNQVFVFGNAQFAYNSNIFAQAGGEGDSTYTAGVGAELKRKAGLIGVDCIGKVDFVAYGKNSDLNAVNPNLSLVLTKESGRTTGSFSLQAYRETRSDNAVNLRTSSWNFPIGLNVRYPINEKFYGVSQTTYLRRTYEDNNALVNYTDLSEGVDLYYTYTSKLDLFGGYRLRWSDTAISGRTLDNWLNLGATGGLFSKLSGTVRVGYQNRHVQRSNDTFNQLALAASLNWPLTRKIAFSFTGSRDFNTIATGESADSTTLMANAIYTYSRKLDFQSGVGVGRNEFLSESVAGRKDTFFTWNVGGRYKMNEHFQVGASYTYFHNWSSLSFADFESHGISLDVSGRY